MRVLMRCNGAEIPLGPFVTRVVANVCTAVAASLDGPVPAKTIGFEIRPSTVGFNVDGVEIDLDRGRGFATTLIRSTLLGLTGELKGIRPGETIRIEVDVD